MLRLDDNKKSNEKKILFDIVNKINKEAKKEQVSVPYYLNKLLYKKDMNTFSDVCSYLYALDMINLNLFTDDNMIDSFGDTRILCEENAENYLDETVIAIYKDILYKQKSDDHSFDNRADYIYHLFTNIVPMSTYVTSSIIATTYIMRYYSMESIICTTATATSNLNRLRNIIKLYNGKVYPWVYCEDYETGFKTADDRFLTIEERNNLNKIIDKEMNTHIMYWKKFINGLVERNYGFCISLIQNNMNGKYNKIY